MTEAKPVRTCEPPAKGRTYVVKPGYEYESNRFLAENGKYQYLTVYESWTEYNEKMCEGVFEYIVTYCHRNLRLTQDDLAKIRGFLDLIQHSEGKFNPVKGRIRPWAAAVLLFYGNLYLNRTDLSLRRIQQLVDLPFIEHLKYIYQYLSTIRTEVHL